MIRKKLKISNLLGLHARAAAKLVKTAAKFVSQANIYLNGQAANCKSIMGVMMLAASHGSWIEVEIQGDDEIEAIHAIEHLVLNRFGEEK